MPSRNLFVVLLALLAAPAAAQTSADVAAAQRAAQLQALTTDTLDRLAHLFAPPQQSITIPNTFVNGTVANATQVNANFTALASNALNRNGGTMLGTLNSRALTPTADATYDVGTSLLRYRDGWFSRNGSFGGTLGVTGAVTLTSGSLSINGLAYTWPASQTASYYLQTNGSGTLSWATVTQACYGIVVGKTTNYSAALCDIVEVTSGTLTITLPAASGCTSTQNHIGVKNDTANIQTIARTGSDTIDGASASFTSNGVQYESYDFVCNAAGTGWMVR